MWKQLRQATACRTPEIRTSLHDLLDTMGRVQLSVHVKLEVSKLGKVMKDANIDGG
jgi:hypothetical protein